MGNEYRLYEPENNIYVGKDEEGRTTKIIGSRADLPLMNGIARIETMKEITPADIQETVLGLRESFSKLKPEDIEEI